MSLLIQLLKINMKQPIEIMLTVRDFDPKLSNYSLIRFLFKVMLMLQSKWQFMWHENNILFWPLATSEFSIHHLTAGAILTQFNEVRN